MINVTYEIKKSGLNLNEPNPYRRCVGITLKQQLPVTTRKIALKQKLVITQQRMTSVRSN